MDLLDFLFPKRCVGCGQWGSYLCDSCLKKIKSFDFSLCPVCGKSSFGGATHFNCQTRYTLDGLLSCFSYQPPLSNLIFKLKYRFLFSLKELINPLMIENLKKKLAGKQGQIFKSFLKKKPVVVSVPLHFFRFNWRGFNQATLLGRIFADKFDLKLTEDLLLRTRFRSPQTFLKKEERISNVRGVFEVNPKYSPNISISQYLNILLVDDVWTTGATIRTCCNLLKRKGAKEIWGLTLAR